SSPPGAQAGSASDGRSLRRQQVTVRAQPGEEARPRQAAVGAQTDRAYFQEAETCLAQHSFYLLPREQVQRQTDDPLMHRHEAIASCRPLNERSQQIPQKPAATLGIPEVEPAVVHVQHESATGAQKAIGMLEHALPLFYPIDHSQRAKQTSSIIE